jgi:dTDP-glucose 4,6-dehydratase
MRLLITGGAGFIGSALVRDLIERYPRYSIMVLDALTYAGSLDNFPETLRTNPNFRFCHGNVRNTALVEELVADADVVVHFAAETHVPRSLHDTVAFFETDVLGTQAVVASALKRRVQRFIHISSSEVYGTADFIPMTEEHPLNPTPPYASAKAGADRLVYAYYVTYGLPCLILRPFNTYGPHQHLEKVIPRFITSALMGEPLTIHGDGSHSRDWLYVEDLCKAVDQAIHADLALFDGQAINLGTGIDTSILTIAELILDVLGKPRSLLTFAPDRPGQVLQHTASTEKAVRLLGWRAKTGLTDGIARAVHWYTDHPEWWGRHLWMRAVTITDAEGHSSTY